MNEFSAIALFFKEGGSFMWFMLATAVVAVAISIERFVVITRASSWNGSKMVEDIGRAVAQGDWHMARQVARLSNAPAAQVANAMLACGSTDPVRLQMAADDAATLALPPLSRRLPHLNVLANVATLLGLLGTISGLIVAFSAVGAADPAQRSAFMAKGISTALNATAFGLMIAIPTLILQGILVGMVERVAEQVDETAIKLAQAIMPRAEAPAAPLAAMVARPAVPGVTTTTLRPNAAQGGVR
ncbi:MAG: MotA/TolQ/ExbB proton channel family protein [Candidatus Eisenbacteria bacterium]